MTNSTNDRHHLASKNSIDEPVTEGTRFGEAVARRLFLQRTALVIPAAVLASSETAWADDRKKKGAGKARGSDQSARNDASKKSRPENSRSSAAISRHESSPMAAHSGSGGSPYAARSEHSQPIAGGGGLSTAPEAARVNLGKPLPSLYNGWNARNFDDIQNDENAHVAFLVNALGANARPMPNFQNLEQANIKDFAHVSRNLENTGVAAYLGALPILAGSTAGLQYVPAAASIALIERGTQVISTPWLTWFQARTSRGMLSTSRFH